MINYRSSIEESLLKMLTSVLLTANFFVFDIIVSQKLSTIIIQFISKMPSDKNN